MVDLIVMMDQDQCQSCGFGFITYEEGSKGTQKAIAAIPHSIHYKYVQFRVFWFVQCLWMKWMEGWLQQPSIWIVGM